MRPPEKKKILASRETSSNSSLFALRSEKYKSETAIKNHVKGPRII